MDYNAIILSGLPGSGKTTLIESLMKLYSWPKYSIGEMYREKWREKHPDGKVSFEEYWRGVSKEENAEVNRAAKEIFVKGNVIGDTRYSIYCKEHKNNLLVFVTAGLQTRAERALKDNDKYKGKSVDDVRRILVQREYDEMSVGNDLFRYDYRDSSNYHITLNSGMLSVEDEVYLITRMVLPISLKNMK